MSDLFKDHIGIIAAMVSEARDILSLLQDKKEETLFSKKIYKGTINNKNVIIIISGCGKVNAAIATTLLIAHFSVKKIIVIGVSGSLNNDLQMGDIVIGKSFIQHDLNAEPLWEKYWVPYENTKIIKANYELRKKLWKITKNIKTRVQCGLIISGDIFLSDKRKKESLLTKLPTAICIDMESAAVAQVCSYTNIPFGVVRIISDDASSDAHITYSQFIKDTAAKHCAYIIQHII